jgi:hypothetical protein
VPSGGVGPAIAPTVGVQYLLQQHASQLMHGGADRKLARLQVYLALPLPIAQQPSDQVVYFLGDLLANRVRNFFFSCSSSAGSSTSRRGRCAQIFSLTSTNSRHRRTKVR